MPHLEILLVAMIFFRRWASHLQNYHMRRAMRRIEKHSRWLGEQTGGFNPKQRMSVPHLEILRAGMIFFRRWASHLQNDHMRRAMRRIEKHSNPLGKGQDIATSERLLACHLHKDKGFPLKEKGYRKNSYLKLAPCEGLHKPFTKAMPALVDALPSLPLSIFMTDTAVTIRLGGLRPTHRSPTTSLDRRYRPPRRTLEHTRAKLILKRTRPACELERTTDNDASGIRWWIGVD